MKKNRKSRKNKSLKEKVRSLSGTASFGRCLFFLALMILVTGVAFAFRETIDLYLSGSRTNVSKRRKKKLPITAAVWQPRSRRKGAVLLKNENNTLPLSKRSPG